MRHRTSKTVVAALAAGSALVLLPAGSAFAGTGPAPGPDKRAAAKSTAPSAAGNPASVKAQAAGVCSDAYQIGSTGYITRGSEKVASVKQFYSPKCAENYSYLWVWQSFRDKGGDWDVTAGVYSYTQDEVLGGKSWKNSEGQEYWSDGTDTAADCTAAVGSLRLSGNPLPWQGVSSKRC